MTLPKTRQDGVSATAASRRDCVLPTISAVSRLVSRTRCCCCCFCCCCWPPIASVWLPVPVDVISSTGLKSLESDKTVGSDAVLPRCAVLSCRGATVTSSLAASQRLCWSIRRFSRPTLGALSLDSASHRLLLCIAWANRHLAVPLDSLHLQEPPRKPDFLRALSSSTALSTYRSYLPTSLPP